MSRRYAPLGDSYDREEEMPEYWPARTLQIGRWKVSYCDLMQYIFAVGLLSVIGLVVFGVAQQPPRPHQ